MTPDSVRSAGWRTEQLRRRHERLRRRYLGVTGRGWAWIGALIVGAGGWTAAFVAFVWLLG